MRQCSESAGGGMCRIVPKKIPADRGGFRERWRSISTADDLLKSATPRKIKRILFSGGGLEVENLGHLRFGLGKEKESHRKNVWKKSFRCRTGVKTGILYLAQTTTEGRLKRSAEKG